MPAFLGLKFIPALVLCFLLTDLFIGFHSTAIFTWGSVVLIGLISKYFFEKYLFKIIGALFGASIFVVTNFGVWTLGSYGYSLEGFILCYTLAIPFFTYSLISTLLFSLIIEGAHSQTKIFKKYLT